MTTIVQSLIDHLVRGDAVCPGCYNTFAAEVRVCPVCERALLPAYSDEAMAVGRVLRAATDEWETEAVRLFRWFLARFAERVVPEDIATTGAQHIRAYLCRHGFEPFPDMAQAPAQASVMERAGDLLVEHVLNCATCRESGGVAEKMCLSGRVLTRAVNNLPSRLRGEAACGPQGDEAGDNSYHPDWVSPPGDTIGDCLRERGISVKDFAKAIGWQVGATDALLTGALRLTPDVAAKLPGVIGGTEEFWLKREEQYRESLDTPYFHFDGPRAVALSRAAVRARFKELGHAPSKWHSGVLVCMRCRSMAREYPVFPDDPTKERVTSTAVRGEPLHYRCGERPVLGDGARPLRWLNPHVTYAENGDASIEALRPSPRYHAPVKVKAKPQLKLPPGRGRFRNGVVQCACPSCDHVESLGNCFSPTAMAIMLKRRRWVWVAKYKRWLCPGCTVEQLEREGGLR